MTQSAVLAYPRIGLKRELKRTLESYWKMQSSAADLQKTAAEMRRYNWELMRAAGIDIIPSNDFSLYDQVLDTSVMLGAVPERYGWSGDRVDLGTYFAMARGAQKEDLDVPAMEMTKWFDTNYHYIVPEFTSGQTFKLASTKAVDEYKEAKALGIKTRPVLLGPVSYLLLGKSVDAALEPLDLLEQVLPVYQAVLKQLAEAGAEWVQIDEPCLVLDLSEATRKAYQSAYQALAQESLPKLMLTTYFGALGDNLSLAVNLPTAGLHIDLVRAPQQLEAVLQALPADKVLSLGLINGRNIWRADLDQALEKIEIAVQALGQERVVVASSCSLQFTPYDLDLETELDEELRSWLAFAKQKLDEIALLTRAANGEDVAVALTANRQIMNNRRQSERTHNPQVRERMANITADMLKRNSPHSQRKRVQEQALNLPAFPTTTIGSFPQTPEIRTQRAAYRKGDISQEQYENFLKAEIEHTVRIQEEIGLDVLVHGEAERTDMVEYFGEQFTGVAFTKNGWIQSYGSRGVKPPVIYGDVARPKPMTVSWSAYAQSLTDLPMKGMLTGPVTILQWSFVRDDQPRSETCRQIGLAIRDEVLDLEANGIHVIQIDEPAIREGLPLRQSEWKEYLKWAVECFRLSSTGVADETQIHTHMCYAEFNDIIEAIGDMDADVISIEASRSKLELLTAFTDYAYPNDIGPGVYDIHSPRIPDQAEIEDLLKNALDVLEPAQVWINPDCGLKTRTWEEVTPSLVAMVKAAKSLRQESKDAQ
ncbi:5-methyltetrahydropteroyltriglutamate--homocysteine S-methyltransferase [Anaerolineales bacterium]